MTTVRPEATYRHQVRFHEVDLQGYFFNARYLELADVAMAEYLRSLGWAYADLVHLGFDPSVVTAQLAFMRPARLDDVLDVHAACTRVGRSSFELKIAIFCDLEEVAAIDLVYVNVDAAASSSRALPQIVEQALRTSLADHGTQ
jgi:acyl-CoA thioester hydrolase